MAKQKRFADRPANHRVQVFDWHPIDLIEEPKAIENAVLEISWIVRIGGFVQRGFDGQLPGPITRGGSAEAPVTFHDGNAFSSAAENCCRGQSTQP